MAVLIEQSARSLIVRQIGRLTTWHGPVAESAAVVITDGTVSWVGAGADLPAGLGELPELDAAGAAVMPGFVDAHTHSVFVSARRDDLAARVAGADYAPTGIGWTCAQTRAATDDELLAPTAARLAAMRRDGTTTVEIKSGYALEPAGELRLIRLAAAAADQADVSAELTYLAAHVLREGCDPTSYVEEVIHGLPAAKAAGAQWCDVFCDIGAFSIDQTRAILTAARAAGFGLRMHAEQLALTGAAELAASVGCASADHLERVNAAGAAALAAAGVVAVLTPVASLQTRDIGSGHCERLRAAGATIAIATDCNPGTAWCESMPMAIQLACWMWGMPVDDALRAATIGGAKALQRNDIGHLAVGARGDLIVLASDHENDIALHLGADAVSQTVVRGACG